VTGVPEEAANTKASSLAYPMILRFTNESSCVSFFFTKIRCFEVMMELFFSL
jgi:hypothetical protein